jgi:hypothetical protein
VIYAYDFLLSSIISTCCKQLTCRLKKTGDYERLVGAQKLARAWVISDELAQGGIYACLPAITRGLEVLKHLVRQPDIDALLGEYGTRAAPRLEHFFGNFFVENFRQYLAGSVSTGKVCV